MSLPDLYTSIVELLTWDVERFAAFLTGILAALLGVYLVWRVFGRKARAASVRRVNELARETSDLRRQMSRFKADNEALVRQKAAVEVQLHQVEEENAALNHRLVRGIAGGKKLVEERKTLQVKVEELSEACDGLKTELANLDSSRLDLWKEKDVLAGQLQAIEARIEDVADLEGKIWECPPHGPIPPFRPLHLRRTPIIAVANLKGGVGKTTITANLGATLWDEGKRVLLVDLDYQGSLTSLCLSEREIGDLRAGRRMVDRLLDANGDAERLVTSCRARIGAGTGYVLAAGEELADVENYAMTQWLLRAGHPDVRFQLRQALHSTVVQDDADYVLIDCPPRLTTATLNALTCCDYVLIPVLLDATSVEAVPRFLRWLRILKAAIHLPDLDVLGVVANRTYPREEMIARERDVWEHLPDKCKDVWGGPVYHFHAYIRQDGLFSQPAEGRRFAAHAQKLHPMFEALAREFERRIKDHASRRTSVLH